ncbi:MAG TPA: GYD domain-containing protein [Rhodospirillales bacterium]
MPYYMFQANYGSDAWKTLLSNPQDRGKELGKLIASFGGKLHSAFVTFGDYDIAVIAELPDDGTAMAMAMGAAAGGAARSVKTTVMVPTDAAVEVMKLAGKVAQKYKPPAAKRRRAASSRRSTGTRRVASSRRTTTRRKK